MTRNGRIAALVVAVAMVCGGVALEGSSGGGAGLFVFAALIVIGTVFDAGYRGRKGSSHGQWQRTGEREIDHETGAIIEVWYDPLTGERCYKPVERGSKEG
ncbi:MAG: hypothetical protein ABT11_06665 [Novosphingobium sp. SCN 66-18]|nr:MAG: hypothetical protein ABT11_06665 [Novosphingobium sp. SCN 66-18]